MCVPLILGIGMTMMTPPVVIIYEYFDKYQTLASGIAVVGQGTSTLVVGPVCRILIDM